MRTAACPRDRYAASNSSNRIGNQLLHMFCKGKVQLLFVGQIGRRPRHDHKIQTRELLPVATKAFAHEPLQTITVDCAPDLFF